MTAVARAAGGVLAGADGLEKVSGRIAVSEAARKTLVDHMGGDAVLIPNGVDCRPVRRRGPAAGVAGRGPGLFFIGRIDEPRKGLPVLLEALPAILAEHPDVRLLVAGPGDVDDVAAPRPGGARPRRVPRAGVARRTRPRAPLGRRLRRAQHRRRELRHRAAEAMAAGRRCSPATSTRSAACSTTARPGALFRDGRRGRPRRARGRAARRRGRSAGGEPRRASLVVQALRLGPGRPTGWSRSTRRSRTRREGARGHPRPARRPASPALKDEP